MESTAVDYLIKEFSDILGKLKTDPMQDLLLVDAINKAKAMEAKSLEDCNYAKSVLQNVNTQLDKWIEQCEKQAEIFGQNKMDSAEISSQAMAQAYWNVKQLIDTNGL